MYWIKINNILSDKTGTTVLKMNQSQFLNCFAVLEKKIN